MRILGTTFGRKMAKCYKNQGPLRIEKLCVYSYELALTELPGRLR